MNKLTTSLNHSIIRAFSVAILSSTILLFAAVSSFAAEQPPLPESVIKLAAKTEIWEPMPRVVTTIPVSR